MPLHLRAAISVHTLDFMKLTIAWIYGVLLLVSFLISASLWHWQMAGAYFVSHKALLGDFLPPFVHSGEDGNFYIKPLRVVYMIWFIYLTATLLLPAVLTWLLVRLHHRALNQSWP